MHLLLEMLCLQQMRGACAVPEGLPSFFVSRAAIVLLSKLSLGEQRQWSAEKVVCQSVKGGKGYKALNNGGSGSSIVRGGLHGKYCRRHNATCKSINQ